MIKIGIIGCGAILPAHLRGYRILREAGAGDFRITALCSRNLDHAHRFVSRSAGGYQAAGSIPGDPLAVDGEYIDGIQDGDAPALFTDWRAMLASDEVNAVNDFTPHGMHHRIAHAAAERNLDLLVQKPISVTVAAGQAMCADFEARDLVLGVFENWRYRPRTRYAKWAVDAGHLGAPQMLLMGNAGTWWAPDRIVADTPWRHLRAEAGGITLDLGIHQFHYARYLAGGIDWVQGAVSVLEPVRRTLDAAGKVLRECACDADDTFFASFATETGAVGNLFASWGGHGGPTRLDPAPVVHGTKGRVAGDLFQADGAAPVPLAELYAAECDAAEQARHFPLGLTAEFALAQYEWPAAIRERRAPETDGRVGVEDLACAFALLESSATGARIRVAEVLDGTASSCQREIAKHYGLDGEET